MKNNKLLDGKTAIVTGANRGIGLATVRMLASNGADVWACARTKNDEFENKINEFALESKTSISPIYFDVTDENAIKEGIKKVAECTKTIDVLVNNAGISIEKLFGMTPLSDIRNTMETNFISQINISRLVSRYMMKNHSGSIINIASVAGVARRSGGLAYGSSKSAVIFATRIMALELGNYGIRVNSISPGFISTDMWDKRNDEIKEKIIKETPLGRQGKPDEVASVALFLASDLSSYVTGQNIIVDGGRWGG